MKVKALRGVCIGVGRHLAVAETAEMDEGTAAYLIAINAVEEFTKPPPKKGAAKTSNEPAKASEPKES